MNDTDTKKPRAMVSRPPKASKEIQKDKSKSSRSYKWLEGGSQEEAEGVTQEAAQDEVSEAQDVSTEAEGVDTVKDIPEAQESNYGI